MKYSVVILQSQIALILGFSPHFTFADSASCGLESGIYKCTGINAVYDQSHLNYDNVEITNTATRPTTGSDINGYGIYVNGELTAQKDLTVTTTGRMHTDAIITNGDANLTVNGKLVVSANGISADGINATINSNSTINIGNNSEISSSRGVAVRANLSLEKGQGNFINIGEGAIIKTNGVGDSGMDVTGHAVFAGNSDIEAVGVPEGTAKIVIGNKSNISTTGGYANAVYANKNARIQLGSTIINTEGEGAHGVVAESGYVSSTSFKNYEGGKVDLLNDVAIKVTGLDSYAIYANGKDAIVASRNMDDLDVNNQPKKTSGVFTVMGDMLSNDGGTIDLRMNDGSKFIGNTAMTGLDATINLNIMGSHSFWQMSKNSQVTDLALSNDANVFLGDQNIAVNSTNKVVLTVANLSGNGNFHMRTNIVGTGLGANNEGDLLSVTGSTSGNHGIQVNDYYNGSAAVDGNERLMLVKTADGQAGFHLANAKTPTNDYVDVGAYKYYLVQGDTSKGEDRNNWYLAKATPTGGSSSLTNAADSSVNVLNINYLLNYVETQTLLQRMGALRQSRDDDWDFWTRGFAGRLSSFSSKLSGFDMDYHGFQAGLDKRFVVNNNDLYVGVMAGTAKAKADYKIGHGDTTSYHVGVYGTYKTQNDFYVDAIAKYVVMKNDFNTKTGGGYQVNGDGTTRGYTLGIETGKRFYFNKVKTGWYVEPQAQLTYSHQNTTNIHSSNGLKTKLDDFDSILGRTSAIVGYSINQGSTPVDVYLKTGYVKEFDGKTSYTFNDNVKTKTNYKFDSSWWDNGIGINAQINKKHNVYLEADYATGNRFDNKSIKLGYRLSF